MKTTDFCPYELSKKLKECGFDEPCSGKYVDCPKDPTLFRRMGYQAWNLEKDEVIAPSLYEAQKWLREEKGIDVLVWNCACGYGWEISKADPQSRGTTLKFYDDNGEDRDSGMWLTYENALSAGINVALQLLDNAKK